MPKCLKFTGKVTNTSDEARQFKSSFSLIKDDTWEEDAKKEHTLLDIKSFDFSKHQQHMSLPRGSARTRNRASHMLAALPELVDLPSSCNDIF